MVQTRRSTKVKSTGAAPTRTSSRRRAAKTEKVQEEESQSEKEEQEVVQMLEKQPRGQRRRQKQEEEEEEEGEQEEEEEEEEEEGEEEEEESDQGAKEQEEEEEEEEEEDDDAKESDQGGDSSDEAPEALSSSTAKQKSMDAFEMELSAKKSARKNAKDRRRNMVLGRQRQANETKGDNADVATQEATAQEDGFDLELLEEVEREKEEQQKKEEEEKEQQEAETRLLEQTQRKKKSREFLARVMSKPVHHKGEVLHTISDSKAIPARAPAHLLAFTKNRLFGNRIKRAPNTAGRSSRKRSLVPAQFATHQRNKRRR